MRPAHLQEVRALQPSSRPAWAIVIAFGLVGGALLDVGESNYPDLHIILDTSSCLLAGVLAALLWDVGTRLGQLFPRWLASSFAVTALLELVHVAVTVEWSGVLAPIAAASGTLRPTTWPLAAYVQPIGIGAALWLKQSGSQRVWGLALLVLALGAALFPVFRWLPAYAQPGWLGITRPTLGLVPLLWAATTVISWRRRSEDRTMPALARMAAMLCVAHATMLFSRSPHDATAMVAHLGKVCGFLVFLLSLMQIAASDMRERIHGESALREAHDQMEARVRARTAELATVNENLQTSEARLAGVVNSAMDAIISVDAEQKVVMFNAAAEKMFRCPAASALGGTLARFIPQRFHERHRRHVAGFGETGVTSRSMRALGALSGVRSDGEEFPIEASISQIEIGGQKIFTVILRDITERKRAETAAAQLVAIVESSEDAIVSKDLAGIVMTWNAGAEKLFGYSAAEMVGLPILRLIPADRKEEETMIMDRIQTGQSVRSFDTTRIRKDGVQIDVSVTVSAIRNEDGTIVGASKTARDITEIKHAEVALREKERQLHESDRRLAEIVQGMTEACFALDTHWRFTFVNERGVALLRHQREGMLGRSIWEVFDKLIGTPMEGHYRRAMAERVPVAFEAFSPVADRWLDIRLFPTAEGLAAFLLDISERKKAEESLRQQEALLRETGHIAKVGGWEFNAETGEGQWTEEVALIHGLDPSVPPDMARGLTYYQGESRGMIEAAVKAAIEQGTPYDLELELMAANGVRKWVRTIGHPVTKDGRVVTVRGSFQDITDRKRAEAAIRESQERFETVVENLTEGLVISDLEGNLIHWNRAGLEMHGFHSLEEGRRQLPEFSKSFELSTLGGTVLPVEQWPLPRIVGGEVIRDVEIRVRRRDSDWNRVFSYSGTIVRDSAGKRVAFVSVTDVTARKSAERILRQTNEQLELKVTDRTAELQAAKERAESADRLKSEFLATMSHELRTPLNGIIGFTELLSDEKPGPLNPKQKQFAGEVLASGRHLLQLINEVLDLSKVAAGRMELNLETFSLSEAIEEVCASIAPLAENKRIALRRDTAEAPPLVRLDRKMTKQILLNLVSNALKFTPDAGSVRVVVSKAAPGELRIAVKDTGIGIRAEDFGKLFVEFQQISSSESRRQQGTGLGLALTKKLVELQGGSITVESVVGQGSTFTVVFPAVAVAPARDS